MKKSDLVAGKHMVQYRNGIFRFVGEHGILFDSIGNSMHTLNSYDEGLLTNNGNETLDIVAVYEANRVWKREEPTITEDEKTILRNLPEKFKWIARDGNGELYIYWNKPVRLPRAWLGEGVFECLNLFNHLFKMVRLEDDEPWKIDDLLKLDVREDG